MPLWVLRIWVFGRAWLIVFTILSRDIKVLLHSWSHRSNFIIEFVGHSFEVLFSTFISYCTWSILLIYLASLRAYCFTFIGIDRWGTLVFVCAELHQLSWGYYLRMVSRLGLDSAFGFQIWRSLVWECVWEHRVNSNLNLFAFKIRLVQVCLALSQFDLALDEFSLQVAYLCV